MSNLYYTEKEFEKIITIFSSHNIKLEFENPKLLCLAIQEISNYCFHKELSFSFQNYNNLVCLEFDVYNKKMLSVGRGYDNSTLNICDYREVGDHLQKIAEIFSFYPAAVVDYFGDYMLMTSADDNKLEKIYYWLDNTILFDIAEDSWDNFLSLFNLSKKNIDFLKLDTNYTVLSYLGFDVDALIDNIGFALPIQKFFDRNPDIEYSSYIGMKNVIKTLNNNDNINNLGLQYSAKNKSYLAIEVFLDSIEQINNLYYLMHKNFVISETEYKNFVDMNISSDFIKYIVKFRWKDENNFAVKLYLEKRKNDFQNNFSFPLDNDSIISYNKNVLD